MSLLDNLPDECTIYRRVRTKGTLGGNKDALTAEQTSVSCWEQQVSASESLEYQQRGMELRSKIYFVVNLTLTRRHQITVTSRNGTAVAVVDQEALDVLDFPLPDVSVGRGLLWRVMVGRNTAEV